MSEHEISYVTVKGRSIPAELVVCPFCKQLDLETVFDASEEPWKAFCSHGHEWKIVFSVS